MNAFIANVAQQVCGVSVYNYTLAVSLPKTDTTILAGVQASSAVGIEAIFNAIKLSGNFMFESDPEDLSSLNRQLCDDSELVIQSVVPVDQSGLDDVIVSGQKRIIQISPYVHLHQCERDINKPIYLAQQNSSEQNYDQVYEVLTADNLDQYLWFKGEFSGSEVQVIIDRHALLSGKYSFIDASLLETRKSLKCNVLELFQGGSEADSLSGFKFHEQLSFAEHPNVECVPFDYIESVFKNDGQSLFAFFGNDPL